MNEMEREKFSGKLGLEGRVADAMPRMVGVAKLLQRSPA